MNVIMFKFKQDQFSFHDVHDGWVKHTTSMSQLCRCKISLHLAISSIPVKSYQQEIAKEHDFVKNIDDIV